MDFSPVHLFGVWNAWWFMIVFPLQIVAVAVLPRYIGERVSHPSDMKQGGKDRVIGKITEIVWVGATLYSVLLPFVTGTAWFYAGLACFVAGLVILILAVLAVKDASKGKPFMNGIYRFSRHPMYLSMILIYLGVSLASASWIFLLITVLTFFLQRHQMAGEERYCTARFGKIYREYMKTTPRWIGFPTSQD